MHSKRLALLGAAAVVSTMPCAAQVTVEPNREIVAILDQIATPPSSNAYTTDSSQFEFDLALDRYAVDCSAFVSYVLYSAYPELESIAVNGVFIKSTSYTIGTGADRHGPTSDDYVAAIAAGSMTLEGMPWLVVRRSTLAEVERGDVIARSGHVMIVESLHQLSDDFWAVDVIDSTSSSGHSYDTKGRPGVGRGWVFLCESDLAYGEFEYWSSTSPLVTNLGQDRYTGVLIGSFQR